LCQEIDYLKMHRLPNSFKTSSPDTKLNNYTMRIRDLTVLTQITRLPAIEIQPEISRGRCSDETVLRQ